MQHSYTIVVRDFRSKTRARHHKEPAISYPISLQISYVLAKTCVEITTYLRHIGERQTVLLREMFAE